MSGARTPDDVVAPGDEHDLVGLLESMPSPVPLMKRRSTTPAAVRRDRGVEEVDLSAGADLDVLVRGGGVRSCAPQNRLRGLEPLGLDVEAVLGPKARPSRVRRTTSSCLMMAFSGSFKP
jgi:hypothetical protein